MKWLICAVVCLFAAEAFAQNPFIAIRGRGFSVDVNRGRGVQVVAPGVNVDVGRGRGVFVRAPGFGFVFDRFGAAAVPVYQSQVLAAPVPQRFAAVDVIAPGVAISVDRRRVFRPLRQRCR